MKKPLRPFALALLPFAAAACAKHSGDVAALTVGSPPRFETRIEIDTGTGSHADYQVADFTGDGKLDMAVISLTGELRILVGNGTSFAVGQQEQINGVPSWMDSADFDGDGDRDIVIVRSEADTTDIWRNDGSGTFTLAGSAPVGAGALAVTVGEFDNGGAPLDGVSGGLDVAISRPSAPQIVVLVGDGNCGFAATQLYDLPNGGSAFNLSAANLVGSAGDELVVADPQLSRLVIFNFYDDDSYELQIPGSPGGVSIGDFSGDGVNDLVVSAFTANRYVVVTGFGHGKGDFWTGFDVPLPGQPSLSTVADVTGDGINDLVGCIAFKASLCVIPGSQVQSGAPAFDQFLLDTTGLPLRPFAADFDGNGKRDVFALSGLANRVNLWLAKDDGTLAGARNYASGLPGASWIEGADFDGDGDFEVATGSNGDSLISILGRQGNQALAVEATIPIGRGIYQLESVDLDVDGKMDLVVGVPGGLKLLRNTSTPGNYTFTVLPGSPATIASGDYPFGIALGDFDRDGDVDIALCDYQGGGVHVVPGTPTPFVFGAETVIQVGGGPIDVAAADFTGDGLLDLAVSRNNQSDIVVLRNDGTGAFAQFLAVPVGDMPNYLITADFNRDGRSDLVVSNASSNTVSVLFGTGSGFLGGSFAAGASPTALLARDLTGDGIVDILVTSLQSGDFRVLVGTGDGSFPLLPTFPGTLGASDAVLQDMDGDGLPDLLISSLISSRVSLVKNISR